MSLFGFSAQVVGYEDPFHLDSDIYTFSSCRPPGEQQSGTSAPAMRNLSAAVSNASSVSSSSSGLMRQNSNATVGKPGPLPTNLDDMKVKVQAAISAKTNWPFIGIVSREGRD